MISCYYDDDGSQVRLKIPLLQKIQIISKSERDLASKNYFAIKIIHNSHFFIVHTREERLFHEFLKQARVFWTKREKENNMQMRKPSKSHLEWNSCKNISLARSTRGWVENEENSHPARCMSLISLVFFEDVFSIFDEENVQPDTRRGSGISMKLIVILYA